MDEIEKGLAAGDGESGTSKRVLGHFLTWLAEKSATVFVVATANEIADLPPELVRKGRFDEIFFVDLPSSRVRVEILSVHLKKRGQDSAAFDLGALAAACNGFSGAEIEQAVVSAFYSSHVEGKPLDTSHVLREMQNTRPLAVVMHERLRALRAWARGRTVPSD